MHCSLFQVFTILFFLIMLMISGYGISKVKDGLDLTDIVPKDTAEYKFLQTQSKYFGFYNVYMVTKVRDWNYYIQRSYKTKFAFYTNKSLIFK